MAFRRLRLRSPPSSPLPGDCNRERAFDGVVNLGDVVAPFFDSTASSSFLFFTTLSSPSVKAEELSSPSSEKQFMVSFSFLSGVDMASILIGAESSVRRLRGVPRRLFEWSLKHANLLKHVTKEKKVKGSVEVAVVDTLLDVVDEVARKIEEMMPGDQGGAVEAGKVNLAAFAKGCFSQDGLGGFVSVFQVAGIV